MLKGIKVLVTAGGTTEYIDDVRVMTNTSSGATGATIASELCKAGAEVFFVHGINSRLPTEFMKQYPVFSAQDACDRMEHLVTEKHIDAVVHAMAVSDFTFDRKSSIKCKSNDPEAFIEYMSQTICLNPKIIKKVKQWRPDTVLIGFKYEVGASVDDLRNLAHKSIESNGCDLVVVNDKKIMDKAGTHVAQFIYSRVGHELGFLDCPVVSNSSIASLITKYLEARFE